MAKPIAEFLKKSGLKGHAQVLDYYDGKLPKGGTYKRNMLNEEGGEGLNRKFKEVLVAALLVECGDVQGEGRNILETYTKDVNGHFAEYAHHVLTTVPPTHRAQSDLEVTGSDHAAVSQKGVIQDSSSNKKPSSRSAKNSWASQEEWNQEKRGYEWLFAFMDQNHDGQVDPEEYEALQQYKKKHGRAWQDQARKELEAAK